MTAAEVKRLAEEIGTTPGQLRRVVEFIDQIEDYALDHELAPEDLVNGLVTVLTNTIALAPPEKQGEVLSGLYLAMHTRLKLPIQ